MISRIVAKKVKDSWHVEIVETETLMSASEVHELIRQKGLGRKIQLDKDGNIATTDVISIVAT
ncbi:hypothetical protein LCGC14_1445560 [marine sediment metagenome]|uniref:Uncharacterized protein n=1 Tax=marine sediment metagenome TaxID=412755 RepID=A0A0F9JK18_9ZZZZ